MDEDEKFRLRQSVIKEVKDHIAPSPTTQKWHKENKQEHKIMSRDITQMKINIAKQSKDIEHIKECVDDLFKANDATNGKIDSLHTKIDILGDKFIGALKEHEKLSDGKYSAKWVEWIVKGAVGLILISFLGYLINLAF